MVEDAGYGPPPGNPSGPARAANGERSFSELARLSAASKDPAFAGMAADVVPDRARAKLIYRDNPLVAIQNTWAIPEVRGALYAHITGAFYASGMLCDSMMGDDRIAATLNSRAAGWLGREVRTRAADDSAAAKECHDAWAAWLPRLLGDSAIRQTSDVGTMMGFGHGQLTWDTSHRALDYAPRIHPWHPTYEYYDWTLRRFMAIGQDAVIPIVPGDGKWIEYAPYGSYRGWIRGAIRAVAEPWLLRHFGFRDMARFGEVHGNPTRKGLVPMVGDPVERKAFEEALANLGSDSAMMVPRGVDANDGLGYDYVLVEATSKAWEVHPAQIDRCDMAIVLAILMVNLTTQVEGGSYGAAKVQMDVRSQGSQLDNATWKRTLYEQIARPFAYLNYGDAELAPTTWWDVKGDAEYADKAKQFQAVGTALQAMAQGGVKFSDMGAARTWIGETFGLDGFPVIESANHGPVPGEDSDGEPDGDEPKLELTPSDIATVVTVDEARASVGLPPMGGADGALTVAAYKAKYATVIAEGAAADAGQTKPTDPSAAAPGGFGSPPGEGASSGAAADEGDDDEDPEDDLEDDG